MDILWAILAFGGGILILFLICKLLAVPLKIILKLVGNAIVGAVVLILFNLVGGIFGFTLPLNALNALVVGVLGIPGILLLVVLRLIF